MQIPGMQHLCAQQCGNIIIISFYYFCSLQSRYYDKRFIPLHNSTDAIFPNKIFLIIEAQFHGVNIIKKGKGSFYIAQYPVRWTAQSALHFLPSPLAHTSTHLHTR